MIGETDLNKLIKSMRAELNTGEYVFCKTATLQGIDISEVLCMFKETEAITLVLKKEIADKWQLPYHYAAAWISLKIHSSLAAVGLTAAFSTALAEQGISCNVVAAYYHDHIFVDAKDAEKAMEVLRQLSGGNC